MSAEDKLPCPHPEKCQMAGRCMKEVMSRPDASPASMQDLRDRIARHYSLEGAGLSVTQHVPCPFCGAPEFMVSALPEVSHVYQEGAICRECSRGMRVRIESVHDTDGAMLAQSMSFEQTVGPEQAEWYVPKMRRAVLQ